MTGVDHVVLHVRDLARAKKFYLNVLGLTVEHETAWQCFMHCGKQGVALFEVKDRNILPGHDLNHLALVTDQGTYESVKAELERNGAKVEGAPGRSHVYLLQRPRRPPHPDTIPRVHRLYWTSRRSGRGRLHRQVATAAAPREHPTCMASQCRSFVLSVWDGVAVGIGIEKDKG